jgi:hypothetical protein
MIPSASRRPIQLSGEALLLKKIQQVVKGSREIISGCLTSIKGFDSLSPMLTDSQHQIRPYPVAEIEHRYGPSVHLLNDPYLFTALSHLSQSKCKQPTINQLLNILYRELVKVAVNREFPLKMSRIETRMAPLHPEGVFEAPLLDPSAKVVCVNLARAGTVPSQICFDSFNYLLNPDGVRQDHISINRKVDDKEQVPSRTA